MLSSTEGRAVSRIFVCCVDVVKEFGTAVYGEGLKGVFARHGVRRRWLRSDGRFRDMSQVVTAASLSLARQARRPHVGQHGQVCEGAGQSHQVMQGT